MGTSQSIVVYQERNVPLLVTIENIVILQHTSLALAGFIIAGRIGTLATKNRYNRYAHFCCALDGVDIPICRYSTVTKIASPPKTGTKTATVPNFGNHQNEEES